MSYQEYIGLIDRIHWNNSRVDNVVFEPLPYPFEDVRSYVISKIRLNLKAWYSRSLSHPSAYSLIRPRPGDTFYVPHLSDDRLDKIAIQRAKHLEDLLEIVRDKPNSWWEAQKTDDPERSPILGFIAHNSERVFSELIAKQNWQDEVSRFWNRQS